MLSARARLVRISSLRILTWAGSQPRTKNWRRNGWKMRAAPFSWKQQERVSDLNSDNRKRKGDTHTHSNTVYKHTIERSCRLVGAIACKHTPVLTQTHTHLNCHGGDGVENDGLDLVVGAQQSDKSLGHHLDNIYFILIYKKINLTQRHAIGLTNDF